MSELLRTAILGTQQRRGSVKSGTDADPLIDALGLATASPVGAPSAALDRAAEEGARERDLLLRAGAAQLLRRAGTRPLVWKTPIARAGEETLQRARPGLSALLAGFLAAGEDELLIEALEGMERLKLRLPEQLLPKALATRDPLVRAHLLPVLGERGRWLAEQGLDDTWSWARASSESSRLPENAEALWAEGTVAERERLLLLARRSEPERGRTFVQSSFKADKPEQRRRWIELLSVGLSPADGPFLESVLADRSGTVRLAAARVLLRIPESRVALELRARVDASIAPGLRVELPKEPFDAAFEQLGMVEVPPDGVGKRQWWLAQLIAGVPPELFEARQGQSAAALVAAGREHELARVLLEGWTSAALRFDSRAWFGPLWDAWFAVEEPRKVWLTAKPLMALSTRWVRDGLRAELEPRLVRAVQEGRHLDALSALPRPWPKELAAACLGALSSRPRAFIGILPVIAARIPVSPEMPTLVPPAPSEGRREVTESLLERFRAVLEVRRELVLEIEAHRDLGDSNQTKET